MESKSNFYILRICPSATPFSIPALPLPVTLQPVLTLSAFSPHPEKYMDSVGEGEGGMIWENSTETCILPYVKQLASLGLMHEMVLRAGARG